MLKQYYLGCLSHASYMLWDEGSKEAIVVDPQRDIQQYLDDAKGLGVSIDKVVLTHFHADFIAGHLELAAATGAQVVMGSKAKTDFPVTHVAHGEIWDYPTMAVEILESPGHTPEMINLLVTDKTDASRPKAVLTGDTLFNGDVGRPDLLASKGVTADELAHMLYDSVQMLAALPDDTLVYPAHGAGSMCGKALGEETVTTIGAQKATNYALKTSDRDRFIALVTADQEQPPAYFAYNADLNRRDRDLLDDNLETHLVPVDVDTVIRRANEGAQVVDTRDDGTFNALHLPGTINIGLDGTYATWCGTVLDPDRPILIIADPGKQEESALRLGRIGYDNIEGYLDGGFPTLEQRKDLLESRVRLTAADWDDHDGIIIDVRSNGERKAEWIPGTLHIPLNELSCRTDEVPRDQNVLVHCAGGYRSSLAASILRRHGVTNVTDLAGGINAYKDAGRPTRRLVDGIEQVTVDELEAIQGSGTPLIDVREQEEWDTDRIPGAILRPMSRLDGWADEFAGQEVLLQCRSGNRSQQVALRLADHGVTAHNLTGGILAYRFHDNKENIP